MLGQHHRLAITHNFWSGLSHAYTYASAQVHARAQQQWVVLYVRYRSNHHDQLD